MAFSFGSTPAPSAFGSSTPAAPAPSSSGFGFAATTLGPAPSGGLFGSSPAPSGGLFGSTSGTPTPAPAPSFGFGSTSSSSPFGLPATPTQQQQQPQQQLMMITSSTPYSSLPSEAQRAIDIIHDEIMRHKRTMNNVETMAPALLRELPVVNAADAAAGGGTSASNLQAQLQDLKHSLEGLQVTVEKYRDKAVFLQTQMQKCTTQSVMYGVWPVEKVAVRRGVKLSSNEKSIDPSVKEQLQQLLDQQAAHVDRIELVPSPYMWQTLEDLQKRTEMLLRQVSTLNRELDANASSDHVMDVASIVHSQTEAIARVAHDVARVHDQMELLRTKYNQTERGENVLLKAEMAEYERQVRLEQQSKQQFMKAAGSAPQATTTASGLAPSTGGLFGGSPAPSSTGGLFGSSSAPAPSGGLFGSYPAPASSAGFGAPQPASAPAPGGLFGSTPAPSGGGLFSSNPAPAPSTGGGLFGGTTSAVAPSTTGTTPAPAGFSFAGAPTSNIPAAPVTISTPRAKGGSSRNRARGRR